MNTHTAIPAAAPVPSSAATLGARLAAASRSAQGFTTVVAELRELCTTPRPMSPAVAEKGNGPTP